MDGNRVNQARRNVLEAEIHFGAKTPDSFSDPLIIEMLLDR
jgi:hypothetical protein